MMGGAYLLPFTMVAVCPALLSYPGVLLTVRRILRHHGLRLALRRNLVRSSRPIPITSSSRWMPRRETPRLGVIYRLYLFLVSGLFVPRWIMSGQTSLAPRM